MPDERGLPRDEPYRVGVLTRTFGLAGGIRCAVESAAVPRLEAPCDAWTGYSQSFLSPVRLVRCDPRPDALICWFDGIDNPEKAAALIDRALYVERASVAFEEQFSDERLVGYTVRDVMGRSLGVLAGILRTPAQYVWTVRDGEREWMMPAVDEFIERVVHDDRSLFVRPIPGMIDEEPDDDDAAGEHERRGPE